MEVGLGGKRGGPGWVSGAEGCGVCWLGVLGVGCAMWVGWAGRGREMVVKGSDGGRTAMVEFEVLANRTGCLRF